MTTSEVLGRPLGPQEVLFALVELRANGGLQMTTIAEFDEPADPERVLRGLRAVHARHPMLRSRLVLEPILHWRCDVGWDAVEIRRQAMGPDFDLSAFYAGEASRLLDYERRSWRAVLLTDEAGRVAWLAITVNHAAVDGRSVLVVLSDLDRFLKDETALPPGSLPLLDFVEKGLLAARSGAVTGMPLGESSAGGDSRALHLEGKDSAQPTLCSVERPAPSSERQPRAFLRLLPAADLDRLHRRLHGEGLHLASAFCAAAAWAERGLPGHSGSTQILAPTDIRHDCEPPVPDDAVGEFVTAISLAIGPEHAELDVLGLTRVFAEQLKERRPAALELDPEYKREEVEAQADAIAAANPFFTAGLCVTDIGDTDRLAGRPVGISQVMLMPTQRHGIHPMMVTVITTSAGACLTFGHAEPLTSAANAAAFAERYMAALAELTGGG